MKLTNALSHSAFLLVTLSALGCNQITGVEPIELRQAPDKEIAELARQRNPELQRARPAEQLATSCSGEGGSCDQGQPCCQSNFCSHELNVYGPGICWAPQSEGSFCQDDRHCQSGRCAQGSCVSASSCFTAGESCEGSGCCAGLFCTWDENAYGRAFCSPKLLVGEYCLENGQCQSDSCVEAQCAP